MLAHFHILAQETELNHEETSSLIPLMSGKKAYLKLNHEENARLGPLMKGQNRDGTIKRLPAYNP